MGVVFGGGRIRTCEVGAVGGEHGGNDVEMVGRMV